MPAGVVVSIEEIKSTVTDVLEENMNAIKEQRYHINGLASNQLALYHIECSYTLFRSLVIYTDG